ncbi:xanthine dehydrogenase family protein molybdopterin-binding subunit [Rubrobacter naiadicus]|uniref:xanthine dehydrogenase family protein molybdopterin-binding subunit n=1 Tax=Rubrobacter naiadicus TaxID=1392641 RepID=UPI0023627F38|nr:xanthine dehydrogenase family protein molybdopterin-binding subunit [Rubrobacter naiadicus]
MGPERDGGSYVGRRVVRIEDGRLVRGEGTYVADMRPEGCLEAAFVRSHVAHGRLEGVDLDAARAVPGVVGAYSAEDLPDLPAARPLFQSDVLEGREWPALARERVRFFGQTIAVVLAGDRYAAEDGVEAAGVAIEELPCVIDPTEAASTSAPELFEGLSNVVGEWEAGEPVGEDLWSEAPVVVEASYRIPPLSHASIEARAILAEPGEGGTLTVWVSHQAPHRLRRDLSELFGIPQEKVRVVVPDVGGAFGGKSETFPEYLAVVHLALRLGRPVRWVEDRTEALTAAVHGRGQNQRVRLAADRDGRMLALEVEADASTGAYPHYGVAPIFNMLRLLSGVYRIPRIHARARAVVTNTTPTAPYRGAGRPEAAYAVERTVDLLAARLGEDPAEVRRLNMIHPGELPHETPVGARYDSGDYPAALEKALEAADYGGWRAEQERRRREGGPPLGVGICCYVESAGVMGEYGAVEVRPDGEILALSGASSTGQGHETTFAQVVASVLGVEVGRIRVVEADTAAVPRGVGSYASRSMQVGGAALHRASLRLVEEARRRMAGLCGVSVEEVSFREGILRAGEEEMDLVRLASRTGALRVEEDFEPPQSFPYGCYVAVVEVDPELGVVRVLRLVAADDCGVVVNPLVVDGQIYGSLMQGLGQALYEEVPYDARGRPLVDHGLLDYLLPTFSELPSVRTVEMETPNPNTPLGAKGVGESGSIGAPPAVVNAVADALGHPDGLQMPLTPQACWMKTGVREGVGK